MSEKKRELIFAARDGETHDAALARSILTPSVEAAFSISQLNGGSEVDLASLAEELSSQVSEAKRGDRAESLLMSQAHTLDAIFHATLRRAIANMGNYPDVVEMYMKLALRAQSQCQATLEPLQRKPTVSINQANIAHGAQQINNFPENELLEHQHAERLDFGKAAEAIGRDSEMETVGAVNRTENEGG